MEDEPNRLSGTLKTGWNLILEGLVEQNTSDQLLLDSHQSLVDGVEELNNNLHELSRIRHQLNCKLESIKHEVEAAHLIAASSDLSQRTEVEMAIQNLEEKGYALQLELENIEHRIRKVRALESHHEKVEGLF